MKRLEKLDRQLRVSIAATLCDNCDIELFDCFSDEQLRLLIEAKCVHRVLDEMKIS
jgi:hypothetical protein